MSRPNLLALAWIFLAVGCDSKPSAPAAGAASAEPPSAATTLPSARPTALGAPSAALASAPAASASSPAPAASARPVSKHGAGIELIDAGREPRTALRYALSPGRNERFSVVTGTTMSIELEGRKAESPSLPEVDLGISIQVLEVRPDGTARREIALQRVDVGAGGALDPSTKRDLEKTLSGLTKLKGKDSIDKRGRMRSLELDSSALEDPRLGQLLDQLQQSLGQMSAPFPEEPVGIGARWAVTSEVQQQGMKLQQVATYELTEFSGDKGAARIELKQFAPRGSVSPPGLPPNVKAEIVSLDSRGLGKLRFDLKRSVPEGQLRTKSKIKVRTTSAGRQEDTSMDLDVKIRFVPEK